MHGGAHRSGRSGDGRWGAEVPTGTGDMGGMDHGGMGDGSMPGMMTEQEMADMAAASGQQFDGMWLSMMIRHHEGAVEMARTALEEGSNAEAKELAQQIIDTQQAEIAEMQALLPQG